MIYLDNSATSFPKPPSVYEAVEHYIKSIGASAGRAAHRRAREAMEISTACRMAIADFIGAENPEEIIFTKNATEGLNLIIKGLIKNKDFVTVSPMEHNAVMRPLNFLGAQVDILPLNDVGTADISSLENLNPLTKLVIINHISNVSGAINDVYRAGEICEKKGVPLLVDCSQSAGHFPIDVKKLKASVVFPGHKGLFSPGGIGVMYLYKISPPPLIFGGTGSNSESAIQPEILPDYYESGTGNMPATAGLFAGMEFISGVTLSAISEKEFFLTKALREGLGNMKNINLCGPTLKEFGPVISFTSTLFEPSEIAYLLDEKYDISVRSGLQCAPFAHKAYHTFPQGTVRLSPGYFNTMREINLTLDAINSIVNH